MQTTTLKAPVQGQVRVVTVQPGDPVAAGQVLLVLESMKMEVPVEAPHAGQVQTVWVQPGDVVAEGEALLACVAGVHGTAPTRPGTEAAPPVPAEHPQAAELRARRHALTDAARPEAAARRHAAGGCTVRENVAALLDAGSFTEYGGLAVAAQRSRRPLDELIAQTPADGLVTGIGTVGAGLHGPERARCAVMAYDYSVLAGTQGVFNHRKADRLLEVAERLSLPVVLFAEGGGGARATWTGPSSPGWTAPPSRAGRGWQAGCPASRWWPGAASPAMRRWRAVPTC